MECTSGADELPGLRGLTVWRLHVKEVAELAGQTRGMRSRVWPSASGAACTGGPRSREVADRPLREHPGPLWQSEGHAGQPARGSMMTPVAGGVKGQQTKTSASVDGFFFGAADFLFGLEPVVEFAAGFIA